MVGGGSMLIFFLMCPYFCCRFGSDADEWNPSGLIKVRGGILVLGATATGLGGWRFCCSSVVCVCGCGGLDGKEAVPTAETTVGVVVETAVGAVGTSEVVGGESKVMAWVAFVRLSMFVFNTGEDTVTGGADSAAVAGLAIGSEKALLTLLLLVDTGGGGNWFCNTGLLFSTATGGAELIEFILYGGGDAMDAGVFTVLVKPPAALKESPGDNGIVDTDGVAGE